MQFGGMGDLGHNEHQHESLPVARAIQFVKHDGIEDGEIQATMLQDTPDEDQISKGNGLGNGEASHLQHLDHNTGGNFLHTDVHIKEIDSKCMQGSNMTSSTTADDVAADHKEDGLQELLQLAQEYESEAAARRNTDSEHDNSCTVSVAQGSLEQHGVLHSKESAEKEKKNFQRAGQNSGTKALKSGFGGSRKVMPRGQGPLLSPSSYTPSPSKPSLKIAVGAHTEGFYQKKKELAENGQTGEAENRKGFITGSQRSITIGPSRSNFTIPQPFALATDKRASIGGRPVDGEGGAPIQKVHHLSGTFGSSSSKKPQVSKNLGSKLYVKSVHSESIKYQEERLEKLTIHVEPKHDEEDARSVSSVQSGSKAPKAKASVFTNVTGFNFCCDERAEKRKEFYSRLKEKLNAKEEEKHQIQEKTKEETEAEIRMLRRSLTFKASPMPSFYKEGEPAKVELKKIPTTRPKSPKFTRRNSHAGSERDSNRFCKSIRCDLEHSSNESLQKPTEENAHNKKNGYTKKPVRPSLPRSPSDKNLESKSPRDSGVPRTYAASANIDTITGNGSMDMAKIKVRQVSSVSSEWVTDEEKDPVGLIESEDEIGNGAEWDEESLNGRGARESKGLPVLALTESANGTSEGNDNKGLQKGHSSAGMGMSSSASTKLKPGAKFHPIASDNSQDLPVKPNKSTKKERIKALTPYFRKREGEGNVKQSTVNQSVAAVVSDATVGT